MQHAADYGITVEGGKADFEKVVKRSRGVADGMSKGVQFLMKKNKIDVIMGSGKLKPGKKFEVTDAAGVIQTLEANRLTLATGARSRILPNLPQDGKKVIGYREAMTLPQQPQIDGSGGFGSYRQ